MTRCLLIRSGRLWLTVGLCALFTATATAQSLSFFKGQDKNRKRSGDVPTVITSDSLDVDIANDLATFTGNVIVEDEEMRINCNKMVIHLEASADTPSAAGTTGGDNASPTGGNKRVSKIVCVGDVIIIRKADPESVVDEVSEQKALAGRADYDVNSGQIVLTEDPVLMRGTDSLRGERITIWRDSDKMKVEGGSRLEMKSDSLRNDQAGEDGQ
jgi:lipopolysaccharide export system protein LptA